MTIAQWLIFILLIQVVHFIGTWKLYVKAGRKAWEAAVPVYNGVVLMKIINLLFRIDLFPSIPHH